MDIERALQGRYEIEREIARGAMGTVYAATDTRLDRSVAVKVPRTGPSHEKDFLERFRREALAAAALSHPNIASVFDYGEEDGDPFIVMELVQGVDLAQLLTGGPLEPDRAVWIAAQTCAALAHAHESGIVHRDIKPANIMVCEPESDRVKVTDFGIARAAGDVTLTATGSLFGTPQYISPEQAQGQKAGPTSDLYSVGILLYEMLVGVPPFEAASPVAVAMSHINQDVPPPSSKRRGVSGELDAVVERATARAPERRYATAGDMLVALRDCLGENSSHAAATAELVPIVAPLPKAPVEESVTPASETREVPPTTKLPAQGWRAALPDFRRSEIIAGATVLLIALVLLVVILSAGDDGSGPRDNGGGDRRKDQVGQQKDVQDAIDRLEELIK